MNCVGCGLCASECLGNKAQLAKDPKTKNLALKMVEAKSQFAQQDGADYLYKKTTYKSGIYPLNTVKGVGFMVPLLSRRSPTKRACL